MFFRLRPAKQHESSISLKQFSELFEPMRFGRNMSEVHAYNMYGLFDIYKLQKHLCHVAQKHTFKFAIFFTYLFISIYIIYYTF